MGAETVYAQGGLAGRPFGRLLSVVIVACVLLAAATSTRARAEDQIAEPTTTEQYVELARRFLPKEEAEVLMTERYALLSPAGRETFKRRNARTRFIEHQAFAICYYRALEAGTRSDLAAFRCYDKFVRKYVP